MLTFLGSSRDFCDHVSRRDFLRIGAVAAGGLTLADMLRVDALAGPGARKKNIININLPGGPTHMDTFDLKPKSPVEFRGEFQPIASNVPGMEICELMPRLAAQCDKLAIVRSISDMNNEHNASQSDSGWSVRDLQSIGGRPGVGAVMSKLMGPVHGQAPTFVSMTGFGSPGFLGQMHGPYRPDGPGRANLRLDRNISMDRLNDRTQLLEGLDRLRRDSDQRGMMDAMDSFNQRAFSVITSGELAGALELDNEDPRVVERYIDSSSRRQQSNRNFLLARRLLEVGARCVSLSWGGWDTHGNNFQIMREQLPALDQGLSALLEDLDARGMLEDTIIMMSGEFGRTPRINGNAGRDHWPRAAFFLLGGGGLKTGQVIGSTNPRGEEPHDHPVRLQQVFATVYRKLGIDIDNTTLIDPNGRPQYLLNHRRPIEELM